MEKMWLNYFNNELLVQGADYGVDASQNEGGDQHSEVGGQVMATGRFGDEVMG